MNDESTPKGAHETTAKKSAPSVATTWTARRERRRACNELNEILGRPTRRSLDEICPRITLREVA